MGTNVEQISNDKLSIMFEELLSRGITTDTIEIKAFIHNCKLSKKSVIILVYSDDNEYHYIVYKSDTMGILSYSDSYDTMEIAKDYAIDTADNQY